MLTVVDMRRRATARWRSTGPAEQEAGLPTAPDYAEPLDAWRLWEVEEVGGEQRLRSLYRICFWPVGAPLEARCEAHRFRLRRRPRHSAPAATCTCGIYAAPLELLRTRPELQDGLPEGRSLVLGTASLWGEVVECERGWRAEFAYPSRLFVPLGVFGELAMALSLADYGVPVELLETRSITDALDEMAELAA
jgi:hypothetical protein